MIKVVGGVDQMLVVCSVVAGFIIYKMSAALMGV